MPIDKKFWITFVALLVVSMALGFVNHGLVLAGDYEALTEVMRSAEQQEARFGFMLGAHFFMAFGLSWLYRVGHVADRPWLGQGIRFGLAFALAFVPIYLIYHTVANFPLDLAIKQCLLEGGAAIVLGVTAAFVNR